MKSQSKSRLPIFHKTTAIFVSTFFMLFNVFEYATPLYAARPETFYEQALGQEDLKTESQAASLGSGAQRAEEVDVMVNLAWKAMGENNQPDFEAAIEKLKEVHGLTLLIKVEGFPFLEQWDHFIADYSAFVTVLNKSIDSMGGVKGVNDSENRAELDILVSRLTDFKERFESAFISGSGFQELKMFYLQKLEEIYGLTDEERTDYLERNEQKKMSLEEFISDFPVKKLSEKEAVLDSVQVHIISLQKAFKELAAKFLSIFQEHNLVQKKMVEELYDTSVSRGLDLKMFINPQKRSVRFLRRAFFDFAYRDLPKDGTQPNTNIHLLLENLYQHVVRTEGQWGVVMFFHDESDNSHYVISLDNGSGIDDLAGAVRGDSFSVYGNEHKALRVLARDNKLMEITSLGEKWTKKSTKLIDSVNIKGTKIVLGDSFGVKPGFGGRDSKFEEADAQSLGAVLKSPPLPGLFDPSTAFKPDLTGEQDISPKVTREAGGSYGDEARRRKARKEVSTPPLQGDETLAEVMREIRTKMSGEMMEEARVLILEKVLPRYEELEELGRKIIRERLFQILRWEFKRGNDEVVEEALYGIVHLADDNRWRGIIKIFLFMLSDDLRKREEIENIEVILRMITIVKWSERERGRMERLRGELLELEWVEEWILWYRERVRQQVMPIFKRHRMRTNNFLINNETLGVSFDSAGRTLEDEDLKSLREIKHLEYLELFHSGLTNEAIESFRQSHPNGERILISGQSLGAEDEADASSLGAVQQISPLPELFDPSILFKPDLTGERTVSPKVTREVGGHGRDVRGTMGSIQRLRPLLAAEPGNLDLRLNLANKLISAVEGGAFELMEEVREVLLGGYISSRERENKTTLDIFYRFEMVQRNLTSTNNKEVKNQLRNYVIQLAELLKKKENVYFTRAFLRIIHETNWKDEVKEELEALRLEVLAYGWVQAWIDEYEDRVKEQLGMPSEEFLEQVTISRESLDITVDWNNLSLMEYTLKEYVVRLMNLEFLSEINLSNFVFEPDNNDFLDEVMGDPTKVEDFLDFINTDEDGREYTGLDLDEIHEGIYVYGDSFENAIALKEILRELKGLKYLRMLDLTGTEITDADIEELRRTYSNKENLIIINSQGRRHIPTKKRVKKNDGKADASSLGAVLQVSPLPELFDPSIAFKPSLTGERTVSPKVTRKVGGGFGEEERRRRAGIERAESISGERTLAEVMKDIRVKMSQGVRKGGDSDLIEEARVLIVDEVLPRYENLDEKDREIIEERLLQSLRWLNENEPRLSQEEMLKMTQEKAEKFLFDRFLWENRSKNRKGIERTLFDIGLSVEGREAGSPLGQLQNRILEEDWMEVFINRYSTKVLEKVVGLGRSLSINRRTLELGIDPVLVLTTGEIDQYLDELSGLTYLTEFYLTDQEHIDNRALERIGALTGLRRLHFQHSELGDEALEHLKGLMNLRHLDLRNTNVSREDAEAFFIEHPNRERLRILGQGWIIEVEGETHVEASSLGGLDISVLENIKQPVNVFIDGREIKALSLGQKEEMFKLAGMNPKKLTIVVANALGYEKPPELDLPNIIFTPQSEVEAAGSVRRAEHNLHMSIGVDPAKEFTLIGENKFRYPDDESGFLAVALLYTQAKNQMAFSMKYGLKQINGFFSSVGQALLGLVQEYEAGVVIGRAA